jgi:hypothetical protein
MFRRIITGSDVGGVVGGGVVSVFSCGGGGGFVARASVGCVPLPQRAGPAASFAAPYYAIPTPITPTEATSPLPPTSHPTSSIPTASTPVASDVATPAREVVDVGRRGSVIVVMEAT